MVAKVISGKNMYGALSYNENKVLEGKAACIGSENFTEDIQGHSFHAKLGYFRERLSLNKKTKTNTIHISLNFDVTEKFSHDQFNSIARRYMELIGFGEQPYIAYEHYDAAHPHIHILTTNIQEDGRRIDIHNIGRNRSEQARQEIEAEFNLIRAARRQRNSRELISPADLTKAVYGRSETKSTISNVVSAVIRSYKYTTIHEYNAVLKQFNIAAVQGSEGSMMHLKRGLLYSILDSKGNQVGIPIKASSLYGKPTMANLEKQFKLNAALRTPYKERVKRVIDDILNDPAPQSIRFFTKRLIQNQVYPVVRQNAEGRIYGLTYIDNSTRCVFNGSDLGKAYTAAGVLQRLNAADKQEPLSVPSLADRDNTTSINYQPGIAAKQKGLEDLMKDLTSAEQLDYSGSNPIAKRRRKKRKRRSL